MNLLKRDNLFKIFKVTTLFFFLFVVSGAAPKKSNKQIINEQFDRIYSSLEKKDFKGGLKNVFVVLQLDTIIPDETTFFLGLCLSHLDKHQKSQEALLKYIKLAGERGDYFEDAIKELYETNKKLNLAYKTDAMICEALGPLDITSICSRCLGEKTREEDCRSCLGTKLEVCPTCLGQGVVVRFSYYDDHSFCSTCAGKGYVDCTRCQATGKEHTSCTLCNGKGVVHKGRECHYFDSHSDKTKK